MKKLSLLLTIFFINTQATEFFEFASNKTNVVLNKSFIVQLINAFKTDVFFETGTYCGETTAAAMPYFKDTYTVEFHNELFKRVQNRFSQYKNVHAYHGSSPDVIKNVCPKINGNILFWLDAHYSGEGTALSFNNSEAANAVTPIREELTAIKEANIRNCTILIDDIRGFGTEISGQEYIGCWAYPTIQEVEKYLLRINPNFEIILLGDILLAYDKSKYQPEFSETVKACTKTRFYDGYNLTDSELIELESKIINAPSNEKSMITSLYNQMTNYKDPMFWHDLWYGLIQLGSKNYNSASQAFSKIKIRNQQFDKNRQLINKTIYYNNSRIDKYLELCTVK